MTSFNMAKIIECIPGEGLDFGYCAVKQSECRKFTISNPMNGIVRFEIAFDESEGNCFSIEPKNGKLFFKYGFLNNVFLSLINYRCFESWVKNRDCNYL